MRDNMKMIQNYYAQAEEWWNESVWQRSVRICLYPHTHKRITTSAQVQKGRQFSWEWTKLVYVANNMLLLFESSFSFTKNSRFFLYMAIEKQQQQQQPNNSTCNVMYAVYTYEHIYVMIAATVTRYQHWIGCRCRNKHNIAVRIMTRFLILCLSHSSSLSLWFYVSII